MKKVIKIGGMHCAHCSARVEAALKRLGLDCAVALADGTATVSGDEARMSDAALREAVETLGFDVLQISAQ